MQQSGRLRWRTMICSMTIASWPATMKGSCRQIMRKLVRHNRSSSLLCLLFRLQRPTPEQRQYRKLHRQQADIHHNPKRRLGRLHRLRDQISMHHKLALTLVNPRSLCSEVANQHTSSHLVQLQPRRHRTDHGTHPRQPLLLCRSRRALWTRKRGITRHMIYQMILHRRYAAKLAIFRMPMGLYRMFLLLGAAA